MAMETISSIIPEEVISAEETRASVDENKISRTQDFEELHGGAVRKRPKRHSGKGYEEQKTDSFPTNRETMAQMKEPPIEDAGRIYVEDEDDEYSDRMVYRPANREQLDAVQEMNQEVDDAEEEKLAKETPFGANGRERVSTNTEKERIEEEEANKVHYFGLGR